MRPPVTERTVEVIKAMEAGLTSEDKEAIQKHLQGLDRDIRAKARQAKMAGTRPDLLKILDSQVSDDDYQLIKTHLEKMDPALKKKMADLIRGAKLGPGKR
jgi:hypothetical protein